ncbi:MAG: aromatic ring-hydroxylating dioxygenase subunit alpha [Rhizobiaceae bacterium]|nr:aromatic ring-hydroxylating dioxygenase subunit alpha [Rhizobiaceae bacterium]
MSKELAISPLLLEHVQSFRDELGELASAPAEAPQGLPGRFYADQDFFEHETKTVLKGGWHCAGRVDEVPNVGDYFTFNLLGEPIIIVRAPNGINALSNVCRHRGMRLAEGSGNTKRFVCPYHAWIYDTDGALLRATRMKNSGFDPKNCKLGEFHILERFGFIYICLAENAPDFDQSVSGLETLISEYEPENYHLVHTATEIWNTNWKCLVENFMEGYHLSVVHPETLHGYTPTGLSRKGPSGDGFTSYFANYPEDIESRGKGAPDLSEESRHRSTLFSVFPCQVVSVAATLLVSLSIRPLTVDTIEVKWTMSNYKSELDEDTVRQRIALWEEVNREDREKLEIMQQSFGSRFANGGPLAEADYEGTVLDFLHWIARQHASIANSD